MSSRTVVFVGPTLPLARARRLLPDAEFLPPVRHGDLLRLDVRAGDRVLIVDGLFMHSAPVRHREILHLLRRSVTVAGSSSMGALRAAELAPYGMRGVGKVFALYRDGVISGDDEVAIVHGPAEEGFRPLSEPLVNIRIAAGYAVADGALSAADAAEVVAAAASMPFRSRSYRALAWAKSPAVHRFLAWQRANPGDAKQSDAIGLLRAAADGDDLLRPRDDNDLPVESVATKYFHLWLGRHQGWDVQGRWVSDHEVATALRLLHPDTARLHRRAVLGDLLRDDWSHRGPRVASTDTVEDRRSAPSIDDDELSTRALAEARRRGMDDPVDDGPQWNWLSEAERSLPAAEATLRVLVRGLGSSEHDRISCRLLPAELARPAMLEAGRRVVAMAGRLADKLPAAGAVRGRRTRFHDEVIDGCYARLWGCSTTELPTAAADRGIADIESFRILAEPFVVYLRLLGRPSFPPAEGTCG